MGEYDPVYGSLVLCSILCSISGTCRLVFHLLLSTQCSDDLTHRRFLWEPPWSSGLQHCNSGTCGSFYYQFLAGDASY